MGVQEEIVDALVKHFVTNGGTETSDVRPDVDHIVVSTMGPNFDDWLNDSLREEYLGIAAEAGKGHAAATAKGIPFRVLARQVISEAHGRQCIPVATQKELDMLQKAKPAVYTVFTAWKRAAAWPVKCEPLLNSDWGKP